MKITNSIKKHKLHEEIGNSIEKYFNEFNNYEVIRGRDCGGIQDIPLSCSDKSRSTRYALIDLIILRDKDVRVIIEIEEYKPEPEPLKIFGKFLASALSNNFTHYKQGYIPFKEPILFIQIVNITALKPKSSKKEQYLNIENSIKNILPVKNSKISFYKLIPLDSSIKKNFLKIKEELINLILNF